MMHKTFNGANACFEQQELALFEPPSFDDLIRKHNMRWLRVTFNKRLRSSWHVTLAPVSRVRELVIPVVLKDAPEDVKMALLDWGRLPWRPKGNNRRDVLYTKKNLEQRVWDFLHERGISTSRKRAVDPRRYRGNTQGTVHDLQEVYQSLNAAYFKGRLHTLIRWGTYASSTSYQSLRHDTEGNPFSLITIAGVYDHPDVPLFAVASVVFHEMLHVTVPPYKRNGRNVIHGPEFKAAERAFPHYRHWQKWERRNLGKLIRSLKRKKVNQGQTDSKPGSITVSEKAGT